MSAFPKNRWYRQLAETVSPSAFHLGFLLVENFLFPGKSECWATQETLARLTRTSDRNVRRHTTELVEAGFLTLRRGGKGHANRYAPILLDQQKLAGLSGLEKRNERTNSSGQNRSEAGFDRTDSSCVDRTDLSYEIPEQKPGDGTALGAGPIQAPVCGSNVVAVGLVSPAPDARRERAGADVVDSTSTVSTVATLRADAEEITARVEPVSLADRIDALDDELAEFRDADTGALADELPRVVRDFFIREVDPGEAEFAEIDHAFRQWLAGDFVEPATIDEELAEFQRRRALRDRDDREPVDFTDFDDEHDHNDLPTPKRSFA